MSKCTPDCTQCADRPAVAGLGGWCQECEDAYASHAEPSPEDMAAPPLTPAELRARYPWVRRPIDPEYPEEQDFLF